MKTKHPLILRILPPLALLAITSSLTASEDDLKAKAVLAQYRDCVVTVQAVAELHMSAESEGKQKAAPDKDVPVGGVATIVRSEGILVSAFSFFDPSSAFDGKTINGPGGKKAKLDVSVGAIKQVKFVLGDGTEVPGEVLLKDAVLDIIVLRADADAWKKAGAEKLPAVDLDKSGEAELLDTVVVIGLSGPGFGREVMASGSGIIVKATKPRLVYRPTFAQKGGPAFLLNGRLLGIGAQHVYRDKLVNDSVFVPAADVADVVRQALASRAPAAQAKP
ncbi:MAG: S1 family peptidase [Verrucomicrobiota bacterium]